MDHRTVVYFEYVLKDAAGTIVDQNDDGEPMAFLVGHDNIVPGLEREIVKHATGDRFDVEVQPKDGYGERDEEAKITLSRSDIPGEVDLELGLQLFMEDEEGNPFPVWIESMDDEDIVFDCNHPLADQVLHFQIKIVEVRQATEKELEHGHPHGDGGVHH